METLVMEVHLEGTVAAVTLNRPQVMNALNTQMGEELSALLRDLNGADNLRAVVFAGAGDRAFCAGADLKERNGMTDPEWLRQHRIFQDAFRSVRELRVPTLAAVEGYAFGGGCELAMSCDLILASEKALFSLPEATRGIIPGIGGTQLLPRLVGRNRAKELLFTGQKWTATQAAEWGMVVEVTVAGTARSRALERAAIIARNAPIAVRQIKKAVDLGTDLELHTALALAVEAYNVTVSTEDRHEGIRAFNEKRQPCFHNR